MDTLITQKVENIYLIYYITLMAGGNKTEKYPECVVLSVQQNTGKFFPRLPDYHGEENIYSPHGPNVIDLNSGVYLRKKDRSGEPSWSSSVEIRNPGHKRIEIVTDPIGGQIISPWKDDIHEIDWFDINENITVRKNNLGHVAISSNKINTCCELRIYDSQTSRVPIACVRLDFVSDEKANKIFEKHQKHQERIHKYLRKKGWIDQK